MMANFTVHVISKNLILQLNKTYVYVFYSLFSLLCITEICGCFSKQKKINKKQNNKKEEKTETRGSWATSLT